MQERVKSMADDVALPAPSAELVLIRTGSQALVKTLGPRKGAKFVREWARLLADEETVRTLLPVRPASESREVTAKRRQALAWLKAVMPTLLASVPPED